MIHRVYSDLPGFKNLEFRSGFNLLLAKRHKQSNDLQTLNRAGKSSFVQIVHFLLGSNAGLDSIFRNSVLADTIFGLDFDLGASRVIVERQGKTQARSAILKGASADWPIQPSDTKGVGISLSTSDWCSVLGQIWFGLKSGDESLRYQPTFRTLCCYFARREAEDGMRCPEMQSRKQQLWDKQIAVAYLLGLDWTIGSEWQIVRDREKSLTELQRAAKQGIFGAIISTSAQLRTQLVVAEQAARRVQESLECFEVLPEYRELEREATELTQKMGSMSDENTLDEEIIETIRRATQNESVPVRRDIERMYDEAGVILPEAINRQFQEVESFHTSIIANRRHYLQEELDAAENRLAKRRQQMATLDLRRAEIIRLLKSRGALDQFQQLQLEASRLNATAEALRQRFQTAQQLEGFKSELKMERSRLSQRLHRDLIEQADCVAEAIAIFEEISNALYEDAGSLTLIPADNGLKVEIQIQGDRSRGIRNMQIFCFDIMLMRLCTQRGIGPKFLIHDSHLFDGVDERQVAKALQIGAQMAETCGWQYIVTMNEDAVPRFTSPGFNLSDHTLDVRLSDEREDGGLFGFRF